MPELPEVETTKEGIKAQVEHVLISGVTLRNPRLRLPVPTDLADYCVGKKVIAVTRRAKYILLHLDEGWLLIHLGMSGHVRFVPTQTPPQKHDHLDIDFAPGFCLRYCDPRRFGMVLYLAEPPETHPLLRHLGPEPLTEQFHAHYLAQQRGNKKQAVKSFIMDNHIVVGVGNIYATESLFLAGIHPQKSIQRVSDQELTILTAHIKTVLTAAIQAGGTTLRDFYSSNGKPGYFRTFLHVYGRRKQPCFKCSTTIESVVIAGRHSAFCPNCQLL